jgi:predicted dehydrogenase
MSITLRFPDGSLATILYCCVGNLGLSKELVEIYGGGGGLVIDDYRAIRFAGFPAKDRKQTAEHKGQYELMENFIKAIRGEAELSVTARDGLRATRLAREALRQCNGGLEPVYGDGEPVDGDPGSETE